MYVHMYTHTIPKTSEEVSRKEQAGREKHCLVVENSGEIGLNTLRGITPPFKSVELQL